MELYKTLDDTLTVPKGTVGYSKEYLLAEIDDLADEFSEIDENGLHSERWCGIMDAKQIVINAPFVLDRPQGEWIEVDDYFIRCKCSICGWESHKYEDDVYGMPYCPNCGAKMKGADDETTMS